MYIKKLAIRSTTVITLLFCYCLADTPVLADDDMVVVEKGAAGIIFKSKGIGYPPMPDERKSNEQRKLLARRAATVDAQRNLIRFIYGSEKVGGREVVSGVMSGAEVTSSGERPDRSYEVELTLSCNDFIMEMQDTQKNRRGENENKNIL